MPSSVDGFLILPPTTSEFDNGTLLIRFQMHNLNHRESKPPKLDNYGVGDLKLTDLKKRRGEIALAEIFDGDTRPISRSFAKLYSQY